MGPTLRKGWIGQAGIGETRECTTYVNPFAMWREI